MYLIITYSRMALWILKETLVCSPVLCYLFCGSNCSHFTHFSLAFGWPHYICHTPAVFWFVGVYASSLSGTIYILQVHHAHILFPILKSVFFSMEFWFHSLDDAVRKTKISSEISLLVMDY